MIPNCDHSWNLHPTPLPVVSSSDSKKTTRETSEEAQSVENELPTDTPPALTDNDYQWLLLL